MYHPIKKYFTVLVVVILLCGSSAFSQDFSKLLDAVDKIEINLKSLIEKESANRAEAINSLKKQINSSGTSTKSDASLVAQVKSLQGELRTVKQEIELYKKSQSTSFVSEQELIEILSDIEFLKAENSYMRSLADENSKLLVSLDGGASDIIANNQTQELEKKLEVLNHQLTQIQQNSSISSAPSYPISFIGFVDASNYTDGNSGESSFGLDQVELDIIKELSGQASLRADIEYVSDGMGNFDMDLEQGYLTYSVGQKQSWTFSFGKFNAPIGFELLDAPDMYQYSHALVFDNGLPTNLTGFMVSTSFSENVDWTFYLVNGWDVNSDNNKEKTIGTRLGFSPVDNFNMGFSLITGAEQDNNNSSRRTVFDWDATYNPSESWTIGAEINIGAESKLMPDDKEANWNGFLLMTNFAINDKVGLTTRFDYFDDVDGSRTGTSQNWKAIAISPSFSIVDGLGGLFELRYDFSDQDVWLDSEGNPKDNNISTALEFTYGF